MNKRCEIYGRKINKNQLTEIFYYKGVPEMAHSICAKGRNKGKSVVNNQKHHHFAPKAHA